MSLCQDMVGRGDFPTGLWMWLTVKDGGPSFVNMTHTYIIHFHVHSPYSHLPHTHTPLSLVLRSFGLVSTQPPQVSCLLLCDHDCTVSDYNRVVYKPPPSPWPLSSLSLSLRSFGFFSRPTTTVLVSVFTWPYGCTVSDCHMVVLYLTVTE